MKSITKMMATMVGVLLIMLAFTSNASAFVQVTMSNAVTGAPIADGSSVPVGTQVRFDADGQNYIWRIKAGGGVVLDQSSAPEASHIYTVPANTADQQLGGFASKDGVNDEGSAYFRAVAANDVPAALVPYGPTSITLPGIVAVDSPKPNLLVRWKAKGVPASFQLTQTACPAGYPASVRCFPLRHAPLGPVTIIAQAWGSNQNQSDTAEFTYTVTADTGKPFPRFKPLLLIGKKGSKCTIQPEYDQWEAFAPYTSSVVLTVEAKAKGASKWRRLQRSSLKVNGKASYFPASTLAFPRPMSIALNGSGLKRLIGAGASFRVTAAVTVTSSGKNVFGPKTVRKVLRLPQCR
jgi:hypothetical protein